MSCCGRSSRQTDPSSADLTVEPIDEVTGDVAKNNLGPEARRSPAIKSPSLFTYVGIDNSMK